MPKLSSTVVTDQPFRPTDFTLTSLKENPAEQARFMGRYTSHYYAGGFAHPTRKDLEAAPERVELYGTEDAPMIVINRQLTKAGRRKDFTGDNFMLPAGSRIASTVCRHHDAPVPDLIRAHDYLTIYPEDQGLRTAVQAQGFQLAATRCTPQAEVLAFYAAPGFPVRDYSPFDSATVQIVPLTVPTPLQPAFLEEVSNMDTIGGWRDDVPFYNAGAWGSLSLRGFWPDDPTRGSKPAEMAETYKREHPEDADRVADWTVMAPACPQIVEWVRGLPWEAERVRIVRLKGGGGELDRHTDGVRNRDFTRLHVPLITNPGAVLHNWNLVGDHLETWLRAWNVYYLDTRKPHAVTNASTEDRIHLIVDLHSTPELLQYIGDAYRVDPDGRSAAA